MLEKFRQLGEVIAGGLTNLGAEKAFLSKLMFKPGSQGQIGLAK